VVGNTQRKYADQLRVTGFEIKSALEKFMNHHTELSKQCPACAANTMLGSLSDDVGNLNVRYWSLFWYVCVLSRTEPWLLLRWSLGSLASPSRNFRVYIRVSHPLAETYSFEKVTLRQREQTSSQLAQLITMDTDTIEMLAATTKKTYKTLDQYVCPFASAGICI
jgi:hypothetical protein